MRRLHCRLVGITLFFLGFWTAFYPEVFTELYGLGLEKSDARSTIRAIIGGGEITLSFLFLFPNWLGIDFRAVYKIGLLLFGSIAILRLFHIYLDDTVSNNVMIEMLIELTIAFLFLLCLIKKAKS
jgi:hypothetical protein